MGSESHERVNECRVYWGSHGCYRERGHEGEHRCSCAFDENGILLPHMDEDAEAGNVGRAPYYGPETNFYGEDAASERVSVKQVA